MHEYTIITLITSSGGGGQAYGRMEEEDPELAAALALSIQV
jgi:hypothetical protein